MIEVFVLLMGGICSGELFRRLVCLWLAWWDDWTEKQANNSVEVIEARAAFKGTLAAFHLHTQEMRAKGEQEGRDLWTLTHVVAAMRIMALIREIRALRAQNASIRAAIRVNVRQNKAKSPGELDGESRDRGESGVQWVNYGCGVLEGIPSDGSPSVWLNHSDLHGWTGKCPG